MPIVPGLGIVGSKGENVVCKMFFGETGLALVFAPLSRWKLVQSRGRCHFMESVHKGLFLYYAIVVRGGGFLILNLL